MFYSTAADPTIKPQSVFVLLKKNGDMIEDIKGVLNHLYEISRAISLSPEGVSDGATGATRDTPNGIVDTLQFHNDELQRLHIALKSRVSVISSALGLGEVMLGGEKNQY
jgi:hypothetical protein